MREAHVPAQHPEAQEDARLPCSHADPRRPGHRQGSPPPGPVPVVGLIGRIRDRATFRALGRARAWHHGPVSLRYMAGTGAGAPRVAFSVGRSAGGAVARNRIRRRLRAAVAASSTCLAGDSVYLFGAGKEALTVPFPTLVTAVDILVRSAREMP
jgi:ribonuclease P protein component